MDDKNREVKIQYVMERAAVSREIATAELEAEEWDVDDALLNLKNI